MLVLRGSRQPRPKSECSRDAASAEAVAFNQDKVVGNLDSRYLFPRISRHKEYQDPLRSLAIISLWRAKCTLPLDYYGSEVRNYTQRRLPMSSSLGGSNFWFFGSLVQAALVRKILYSNH